MNGNLMRAMFLAVHASVGAIAGNAVKDPIVAFIIGFISHFFTDMVPHGDENMYEGYKNGNKVVRAVMYVAADAVLTVVLVALFFIKEDFFHPMNVAMGIVGGLLPDPVMYHDRDCAVRAPGWCGHFSLCVLYRPSTKSRPHSDAFEKTGYFKVFQNCKQILIAWRECRNVEIIDRRSICPI